MADYQLEHEAIYLFSSLKVVAQFTFEQFEKIVDNREPNEQLQGRTINAALLQLDGQLRLRTLVLFTVPFDSNGIVDSEWDIPLRHLAQMATKGPDLGNGRINISCRSQCSVDWYLQDLWEPSKNQTVEFFDGLNKTIIANKLNFEMIDSYEDEVLLKDMDDILVLDEDLPSLKNAKSYLNNHDNKKKTNAKEPEAPVLTSSVVYDDEKEELKRQILVNHEKSQQKVGELLHEQRIKYDSVIARKNEELDQVKRVMRNEMQADKQMVQALQRKISQLQVLHESVESKSDHKDELLDDLQFKYDQQTERFASLKDEHLALLKQHNEHKHSKSDDEDVNELNDEIQTLQMQLEGALNREEELSVELKALKTDKETSKNESITDNALLDKMIEQELIFTAYHPGAGHISIPSRNVMNYLKNPLQYAAQKCSVKLKDYEIWLNHFESPHCEECGIQISRINTPNEFDSTRHVYCTTHR